MGCASSSSYSAFSSGMGFGAAKVAGSRHASSSGSDGGPTPALSRLSGHRSRRLSMRPHSLETRILQIDQVDTLALEPPRGGEPEAPFVDGKWGLRDVTAASANSPREALFCDPDFPADGVGLGFPEPAEICWTRPPDLGEHGPLWTGDIRGRLRAGSFEDRWLAEAIAVVSQRPQLLDKVFSAEQASSVQGAVRVTLWRFGRWETVVVDDRLPVPLCVSSDAAGELWPAILEKAFAKIYGGYAGLAGGDVLWGLEDLTGGVAQRLQVVASHGATRTTVRGVTQNHDAGEAGVGEGSTPRPRERESFYCMVYRPLVQALRTGALISCTPVNRRTLGQEIYISTVVDTKLTVRGPQLCIHDGMTSTSNQWMDLEDFAAAYTNIIVTTLDTGSEQLQVQEIFGWWETGTSSGGSRNNLEKFATNPQYILTITQPDEHEENKDFGRCSLLLALMQEHRKSARACRPPMLPIAYFIYKADIPGERLSAEYFLCVSEEVSTGPFVNKREIAHRAELEPGNYILIPATWTAAHQGAFLLRICTLRKVSLKALPPYKPIAAMLPTWVPVTEV